MLATWGTSTGRNPTLDLQFAGATSLDNRITFSRGSQATLFDSTGALVYAKHNLLVQSQEFGTSWTRFGTTTLTQNTSVAPDGTTTGDNIVFTSASAGIYQLITGAALTTYTFSVWIKSSSSTQVRLVINTNLSDPTTQTFTVTSGWQRFSINKTTAAGTTSVTTQIQDSGSGNTQFDLWGAQLNLPNMEGGVTSSLDTYYPTTTAAYYAPRFDYSPSTLAAQGLLIEEARTNSIRNNTMQGAVAGTPGTVPTNWAVSGRGTLTQTVVGTGTSNNINYIDIRFNGTTSTTEINMAFESGTQIVSAQNQIWASSLYCGIAAGSLTNISTIRQIIISATAAGATLSASTQTFTPTTAAISTQRNAFAYTLPDVTNARVYSRLDILFSSGVAIDITLRIGLPQLEQGAFATSVIPTTTTALTRNADVASMTGTNFSSWFNAAAGSLLVQFSIPAQASATSLATIGDGTANERMIVNAATNRVGTGWRVVDGGVDQCDINIASSFSAGQSVKTIGAYAVNDFAVCQNGGTVGTDVSGTLPTVNALYIGTNGVSTYTNSYIQRIAYYPVRLPNSTLQALTA